MSATVFGLSTSYLFAVTSVLTPVGDPPTGACCIGDGCHVLTEKHCAAEGGDYQGDDSHCPNDACVGTPTGACCVGDGCHVLTEEHCAAEGGAYQGDNSHCPNDACIGTPTGACCIGDGCHALTEEHCAAEGGDYLGDGSKCGPKTCGGNAGCIKGEAGCEGCTADLNGDGAVSASDLSILLGAWGPNPNHPADFDNDGVVDAADLAALLGGWGPCG